MKAYRVTDGRHEASVIVFAASPGKSKQLALRSEWFMNAEYTDMIATREPKADIYDTGSERLIDGIFSGDTEIMRKIGWMELDGSYDCCKDCGLYEWHDLRNSKLDDAGRCVDCANKLATK